MVRHQPDAGILGNVFSLVNSGRGMLHLARHSRSSEGLTCSTELTWFTMASMVLLLSPRVALKASTGKLKNADEIVTVPGSDVGKEAMN